jgi:putative DNA-invertase from lambdoid prophage Rac
MSGRVFGYIRTSTPTQTVAEQQRMLDNWAATRGRFLTAMYVDEGVSGQIPFCSRPAGMELWGVLRRGDAVVAAWLDRLFRRADDCLTVTEVLQKRGVSLYLFDFNDGADDVSGGLSRMIIHVASAFAEHERKRITQRIRATKEGMKARGQYLGGTAPFGWRVGKQRELIVVPEQQRAIETMRQLRAQGMPLRAIADQLTEAGMPISHQGVKKVLAAAIARRAAA